MNLLDAYFVIFNLKTVHDGKKPVKLLFNRFNRFLKQFMMVRNLSNISFAVLFHFEGSFAVFYC